MTTRERMIEEMWEVAGVRVIRSNGSSRCSDCAGLLGPRGGGHRSGCNAVLRCQAIAEVAAKFTICDLPVHTLRPGKVRG